MLSFSATSYPCSAHLCCCPGDLIVCQQLAQHFCVALVGCNLHVLGLEVVTCLALGVLFSCREGQLERTSSSAVRLVMWRCCLFEFKATGNCLATCGMWAEL
jgi:hypothetical protein